MLMHEIENYLESNLAPMEANSAASAMILLEIQLGV